MCDWLQKASAELPPAARHDPGQQGGLTRGPHRGPFSSEQRWKHLLPRPRGHPQTPRTPRREAPKHRPHPDRPPPASGAQAHAEGPEATARPSAARPASSAARGSERSGDAAALPPRGAEVRGAAGGYCPLLSAPPHRRPSGERVGRAERAAWGRSLPSAHVSLPSLSLPTGAEGARAGRWAIFSSPGCGRLWRRRERPRCGAAAARCALCCASCCAACRGAPQPPRSPA